MTQEEQELLIAYMVDTGDLDSEGDLEAQFLDWYQVREGQVSGEVHYKAVLDAAWIRARTFEEGRRAGFSEAAGQARLGRASSPVRDSPLHGPRPPGGGLAPGTPSKNPGGGP